MAGLGTELDRQAIRRIVDAAGERLHGSWLLVGGAVAALWFESSRVTEDVDLVAMSDEPNARLELLNLAAELDLPIEAVNSAADFFVRKIPDWRNQTEPLHQGSSARIDRPTPTLFLLLKMGRLSEDDLADCLGLLAWARAHGAAIDRARALAALDALPATTEADRIARRQKLRDALT